MVAKKVVEDDEGAVRLAHRKLIENPQLPLERHATAFTHSEGVDGEAETIIRVNEEGLPQEHIKLEAYANDYAGYHRLHERKLWFIFAICLLYLSLKLFGA